MKAARLTAVILALTAGPLVNDLRGGDICSQIDTLRMAE
jgi:hypothetical protein